MTAQRFSNGSSDLTVAKAERKREMFSPLANSGVRLDVTKVKKVPLGTYARRYSGIGFDPVGRAMPANPSIRA